MEDTNQRFYDLETANRIRDLYANKVIGTKLYPEHSFDKVLADDTNSIPLIKEVVIEEFQGKYVVFARANDERGTWEREINELLMFKGIINKPIES